MKINLKNFALRALETAKQDLQRDKHLVPVAFIVTDGDVSDFNLDFEGAEQKQSAYAELVEIAKRLGARAIVTINDANLKNPVRAATESQECIYLTVSGPSLTTWSVCVPYKRFGNHIHFGDPSEALDDILNLVPGWPTRTGASVS